MPKKARILELLKIVAPILPAPIYWEDINSVLLGGNEAVFSATGAMLAEAYIGKTLFELYPADMAEHIKRHNEEVMRTGKILSQEEAIRDITTNELKYFTAIKAPLYDDERNIIGIVGTSIEITERKKMEEELHRSKDSAEAANHAKTEFLSNMRHDIRTPLTGIIGFSEVIQSEASDPKMKEYAENLVASGYALLDFMDEVLEAVRVSSGEIPIMKRKFILAKPFEQVTELFAAKSQEKKINLILKIDEKLPKYALGDKIRLQRIALELVSNAFQFTDKGVVTLEVVMAKNENKKLIIKIKVSDTGVGIPKDKQQDIYIQFKRLTPSYQGIYKGAGLGLYVIKQFIDDLGGEISVQSTQGKGSTFTCTIPLELPLLQEEDNDDESEIVKFEKPYLTPLSHPIRSNEVARGENTGASILLIEDSTIAQLAAKAILTALNCQVGTASTGEEALELYKKNKYDLIFMDIGLGEGMDGYEVTRAIRTCEDGTNIPIIALTAHAADENKERCIHAGMNAVLAKPLNRTMASDILTNFLPQRRPSAGKPKAAHPDLPDNEEEMFLLEQFPFFDSKQIADVCPDKVLVKQLLAEFINVQIPDELKKIKQAFAKKDYDLVEKIMHKLKGSALYLGTIRMKYACQYVERYWKTGERALFDKLYHQAVTVIEDTLSYIKAWLSKQEH